MKNKKNALLAVHLGLPEKRRLENTMLEPERVLSSLGWKISRLEEVKAVRSDTAQGFHFERYTFRAQSPKIPLRSGEDSILYVVGDIDDINVVEVARSDPKRFVLKDRLIDIYSIIKEETIDIVEPSRGSISMGENGKQYNAYKILAYFHLNSPPMVKKFFARSSIQPTDRPPLDATVFFLERLCKPLWNDLLNMDIIKAPDVDQTINQMVDLINVWSLTNAPTNMYFTFPGTKENDFANLNMHHFLGRLGYIKALFDAANWCASIKSGALTKDVTTVRFAFKPDFYMGSPDITHFHIPDVFAPYVGPAVDDKGVFHCSLDQDPFILESDLYYLMLPFQLMGIKVQFDMYVKTIKKFSSVYMKNDKKRYRDTFNYFINTVVMRHMNSVLTRMIRMADGPVLAPPE